MEFHFYKGAYDMFYIYTIIYQMILLDDTTLKWQFDTFYVSKIWHCVDTGFDSMLCKYNSCLYLLDEENSQSYHDFFFFS